LIIYVNDKKQDLIGNVSFTTNDDTNGEEMAFSSLSRYKNGDIVKVSANKAVQFLGMIVRMSDPEKPPYDYTAIDFSRNLGGDCLIQFKGMRADAALERLFKRYGIKCSICPMPTKISKIYNDTIINVAKDIMHLAYKDQGKKYYLEVRGSKVIVEEKKKKKIRPTFIIEDDGAIERSIEDMRNRVVVVNQGTSSMKVLAQADAKKSQKSYGLMQHNETADDKTTKVKAKSQAKTLLKELNKQTSTKSVTLIVTKGAWQVRKNRLIYLKTKRLKGWYRIRSCTHEVQGSTHKCTVELEW
jgi:hypothetical protein